MDYIIHGVAKSRTRLSDFHTHRNTSWKYVSPHIHKWDHTLLFVGLHALSTYAHTKPVCTYMRT